MDIARNGGHPDDEITGLWARAQQLEYALESRDSLKVQVLAAEVTSAETPTPIRRTLNQRARAG